jgi:hypothetical protein
MKALKIAVNVLLSTAAVTAIWVWAYYAASTSQSFIPPATDPITTKRAIWGIGPDGAMIEGWTPPEIIILELR